MRSSLDSRSERMFGGWVVKLWDISQDLASASAAVDIIWAGAWTDSSAPCSEAEVTFGRSEETFGSLLGRRLEPDTFGFACVMSYGFITM